jgi:hypothetical protein
MMRVLCCLWMFAGAALAGAPEDWSRVLMLDAGPGVVPKNADEAKKISLAHNTRQEQALRAFLNTYPENEHGFEARLRLARVLGLRADMNGEPQPAECSRLISEAEKEASTAEQHAEVDFARLAQSMRQSHGKRPEPEERQKLLKAARAFAQQYPRDRRVASLLVEVGTLFDGDAKTKQRLLADAKRLTKDPDLLAQIADDTKRLGWLGRTLPLHFKSVDGRPVDVKEWRGKPVVVVFFDAASPPARTVFSEMNRLASEKGAGFVAVSLDADTDVLARFMATQQPRPAVAWDGKGWDGPFVQALGINAVPTVWLLDKEGVVRTLDPLDDPEGLLRQLSR